MKSNRHHDHFGVNKDRIKEIIDTKKKLGDNFPKIGIFIVSYNASHLLNDTVSRIPKDLYDIIEEIFIFDDFSSDDTYNIAKRLQYNSYWCNKINAFKNPTNFGYGGNQKVGFRYAINRGLDYVILLHGDAQYAPEHIPDLIYPAIKHGHSVVFGSRMIKRANALAGGMPFYKWLGNQILTKFENIMLGLKLSEYHTGYRLYSTKILNKIPFEENTNDFHFDSQIIIQCRALNVKIHEVPIKTFYGDEVCHVKGLKYAKNVCLSVFEYRLHQLHIIRRSRYLIDRECVYTYKKSPYSSHQIILSLIDKPGLALDLGGGNDLLTASLKEKGVDSIGVDSEEPAKITAPLLDYYQIDLNNFKKLKFKREFDYIILADVLEHLQSPMGLLRHIRQFLKPEGKIIISLPNIAIWFYRISLVMGRFNYGEKGILDKGHLRFYTLDTARQLIGRSGYVISKIKPTSLPFEVIFESVGKSLLLRLADKIYYGLAKIWPGMFSYQFIFLAKISSLSAEKGEGKIK
jgi:glycosyltransferase involved in cell wall biosynthesis